MQMISNGALEPFKDYDPCSVRKYFAREKRNLAKIQCQKECG